MVVAEEHLRKSILEEMEKDERCQGIERFFLHRVSEPGRSNWVESFIMGSYGKQARTAMDEIQAALGARYELE